MPDGHASRHRPHLQHAQVCALYETFESATFPPAGWTVTQSGGNCAWVGNDPGSRGNLTGGIGKFAIADSDACGSGTTMNTTLTSPVMDVSTLANVNLSYNFDYNNLVSTESADLDVSADAGATWTNVHHWNTDMRGPNTFQQDVTALLGGSTQAQLRYHYIAPGWDWWWEVDNVFVGEKICHPIGGGGLAAGRVAIFDSSLGYAHPAMSLHQNRVIRPVSCWQGFSTPGTYPYRGI